MRVAILLNRHSGTLRTQDAVAVAAGMTAVFREHGHDAVAEAHDGHGVVAAMQRISRTESADAVVVGGGDGTVSAAAAIAAQSGIALGVLPLGTMNLFARALGIPLAMPAAVAALAGGVVRAVDIGEVNGRLFIHHVTLGLHPRMIRLRERLPYSSRPGKLWANAQAWWMALNRPPRLRVRIEADGQTSEHRTALVMVSNNPLGAGHLPYPDNLAQGKLGLYVARSDRWQDLVSLTAHMTLGDIAGTDLVEASMPRSVIVALPDGRIDVSLDGEIVALASPLRFSLRQRGLRVIWPQVETERRHSV